MVIMKILERLSSLSCKKIDFNQFLISFSKTLYVVGGSVDHNVLDFITRINLKDIQSIIILTPFSNLDKPFTTSWKTLSKYLQGEHIDLRMKAPTENIPLDVYFMDKKKLFFIPRNYFEKKIKECCVSDSKEVRNQIMTALASSEDFTNLKGLEIYHKKFDKVFQISSRHLSDDDKERILDGLVSLESSGYEDIEPLWRIFEKKMRIFIKQRLTTINPTTWFSSNILPCFNNKPEIKEGIMKRFEKNKGRYGISNIDDHPNPTEYLNAENYEQIINNNKSVFTDYRAKKHRKYREYIQEVVKSRNASIHDRAPDDDAELYSNIIFKMLISLEWLNTIEPSILGN